MYDYAFQSLIHDTHSSTYFKRSNLLLMQRFILDGLSLAINPMFSIIITIIIYVGH